MKILIINGSPKGEKSVTHKMVTEFIKGAEEAGAECENVFLSKKKVHHCVGCFACWIKTPGKCAIKDDMVELLEKHIASDLVVLACPVYYGSVTGLMKDYIDRTLPLSDPRFKTNEDGVTTHVSRYDKYPELALISNCGFPEMSHFKFFRNIFNYLEANGSPPPIAEIYRSQGPMLEGNIPPLKPIIDNYNSLLRKAGKEVVETGKLSDELREEMEKPIVPPDMYREQGNKFWESHLKKLEEN